LSKFFFDKVSNTMQKIRVGHRATGNALSLYANSKGKRAARDIALQTEWGNAAQEMNTSCDQEPLKFVQSSAVTDWNNAGGAPPTYLFNEWGQIFLPWVPRTPSVTNASGREGRTIQVKGLDIAFQCGVIYGAAELPGVLQQPLIRVIVYIDKQPNLNTPAFSTNDLLVGGVGVNTQNVLDLLNQDNKDRFVIVADYTKQSTFFGNGARSSFSWIDHYDLDYTARYERASPIGADDECTSNLLKVICLPRVARVAATDATSNCTIGCIGRITYTDM